MAFCELLALAEARAVRINIDAESPADAGSDFERPIGLSGTRSFGFSSGAILLSLFA